MTIISVSARGVARLCAGVIAALTLANLGVHLLHYGLGRNSLLGFSKVFNVDMESSLPTWWSSALLFFCAAVLAVIALETRAVRGTGASVAWWGLAAIFLGMSIDEVAAIHETVGGILGGTITASWGLTDDRFYYWWVLIGGLLVVGFGGAFGRFFLRLPAVSRRRFAVAAVVLLSGALGFEVLGGLYIAAHGVDLTMELLRACEEFLEMAGVAIFATALVAHLEEQHGGIRLVVQLGRRSTGASRVAGPARFEGDEEVRGPTVLGGRAK